MMDSPKEFGYGVSQCLTREFAVDNQTYIKMLEFFPGVNNLTNQPADKWPSRNERSYTLAIVLKHALICNNTKFNHWQMLNTWSRFTLLADKSFTQRTPNLVILTTKTFDCFKCLPKSNTIPKLNFGRWHSRGESLRNHCKIGSQGTFTKLWTSRCSAALKWAPRKGYAVMTARANRTRREGTQN